MADAARINGIIHIFDSFLELTGHKKIFASDEELIQTFDSVVESNKAWFNPTDEEREVAIKELQYRYKVKLAAGTAILNDYEEKKWFTEAREKGTLLTRCWDRYADYLQTEQGFPQPVVNTLGNTTLDKYIMDCLADPNGKYVHKRGLIIGDVQSGKTSTYTGLICKAADAGYKVFIILTGTIESLRIQTQKRLEEGFVGFDVTNHSDPRVGVGKDMKPILAECMTSRISDFTGNSDKTVISVMNHAAVVFVIKKNATVLRKLGEWLIKTNADPTTRMINAPMLLIDDEADNASVNTKTNEDPATINRLIRQLVNVFSISTYVGFTATPYANVFIDPLTEHDMYQHDLFPEDFIVALPTPSNYVGAQQIFNKEGRFYKQVRFIDDAGVKEADGYPFYHLHPMSWDGDLPGSLTDALYTYYLANAIRDLRQDTNKHRSMLINMSRYTKVQYRIRDKVKAIHDKAKRAIQFNLSTNTEMSLRDPILNHIHQVWEEQYKDTEFTWEDIAAVLWKAVEPIELYVVNSGKTSDQLVYPENEAIRVIAVGGMSLSRGLTLEGLIVSYFYRNTCTYDVLMQMGRWFGYRKNYEDLFRIWTGESSAIWYAEIADATEQLKRDMVNMRRLNLKPKQFGIRVRDDSDALDITARNKMKYTATEYEYQTYYGNYIETAYVSAEPRVQHNNYNAVGRMVRRAVDAGLKFEATTIDGSTERYILRGVDKRTIVELLSAIDVTRVNKHFDPQQIISFLATDTTPCLDTWDVAFMSGSKSDGSSYDIYGASVYRVKRGHCSIIDGILRIGARGKLGGTQDGKVGITDMSLIDEAKAKFEAEYLARHGNKYEGTSYSSETWFRYIRDRHPMLLIYMIDVSTEATEAKSFEEFRRSMGESPVMGFAIGFPANETDKSTASRFRVSLAYNPFEHRVEESEDENNE